MIILTQDGKQRIKVNNLSELNVEGNKIIYNSIVLGTYVTPHQYWAMDMLEEAYAKSNKTEFKMPSEGRDYTFREDNREDTNSMEYKRSCRYNNSEGYDGLSEMRHNN